MLVEPNEKSRVLATLVLVGISGDLVVPKVNPELVALEVGFSLAFPVSLEVERELSESFGASLVPKEKFREVCGCKIVEVVVVTAFDAVVTATAPKLNASQLLHLRVSTRLHPRGVIRIHAIAMCSKVLNSVFMSRLK